jgi:hypothetical protein
MVRVNLKLWWQYELDVTRPTTAGFILSRVAYYWPPTWATTSHRRDLRGGRCRRRSACRLCQLRAAPPEMVLLPDGGNVSPLPVFDGLRQRGVPVGSLRSRLVCRHVCQVLALATAKRVPMYWRREKHHLCARTGNRQRQLSMGR